MYLQCSKSDLDRGGLQRGCCQPSPPLLNSTSVALCCSLGHFSSSPLDQQQPASQSPYPAATAVTTDGTAAFTLLINKFVLRASKFLKEYQTKVSCHQTISAVLQNKYVNCYWQICLDTCSAAKSGCSKNEIVRSL